jgi:hypothetical protein
MDNSGNLAERACTWLLPWSDDEYPGYRRGILATLDTPQTWWSVKHWHRGRSPVPVWAARRLRETLVTEGRGALALADELADYVAARDRQPNKPVHGGVVRGPHGRFMRDPALSRRLR